MEREGEGKREKALKKKVNKTLRKQKPGLKAHFT
jgi:hypothetical protein